MKKIILALSIFSLSYSLLYAGTAVVKISPQKAQEMLQAKDRTTRPVLIDVRTAEEFATGYIEGTVLLPVDKIDANSAAKIIKDKNQVVIVYCRSGRRSAIAVEILQKLGYQTVYDLGGVNTWPFGLVVAKK